jgi:cell wall-associated NlpC family hydrolase
VVLPSYCTGYHTYVSPSKISIDATREQCIEAFIQRATEYLGTTYIEPYSREPGNAVDCSGLVLQCLYATGMDLEHARGTESVGGYNPYNHYWVPAQTYNSMRWYENDTFMPVSLDNLQRGDIVFYSGHVAIYIGNGKVIHSSNYMVPFNGVQVSDLWHRDVIGAQRPFPA